MGRPKALVELDGEPLVVRALRVLRAGGCEPRYVVVGAAADEVRAVLPPEALVVPAPDWAQGMSASLRAGLAALDAGAESSVDAVLVHLVDLPGVGAEVIRQVAARAAPDVLARAVYRGVPGHPVLLGRRHWAAVADAAVGDAGARGFLRGHPGVQLVECGELAEPSDVDTPEQLEAFRLRPGAPRRA